LDTRTGFGAALEIMERSAQLMGQFLPGHEWDETRNKLQAFRLFAYVDEELGISRDSLEPLSGLIGKAFTLDNFRSIWALEGVAHYYTRAALAAGPVKGLLSAAPDNAIPERTLVPMHAGMGTSFAELVLSRSGSEPADLRAAVSRFFNLCRDNSSPGWCDSAVEPLGLVVRITYPHLVGKVGDVMGSIGLAAQRLYWHGVGRSLYFVPTNFMTFAGSHERALRAAIAEPPTYEDRCNAVAGLVWAVTLVNLRHPAVLRNLLAAASKLNMDEAVIHGIVSALLVWRHMIPGDRAYLPLYTHTTLEGTSADHLWTRYVATPVADALAHAYPVLQERNAIASLFTWRAVATKTAATIKGCS
jgi:hypothetical protein